MSTALKTLLSMSFSGGLLILALLLGKRLLKDRVSRQWQYYIWLAVILRRLLPFGPEGGLLGKTYRTVDLAITQAAPLPQQPLPGPSGDGPTAGSGQDRGYGTGPAERPAVPHPLQNSGALLFNRIPLIYLAVALGLLIRKITIYQGFTRYVRAGATPVCAVEMLDRLSTLARQAGVRTPAELCVNPLVSSPLLIGFFRPCIVLPGADIPARDFQYIALHELTHHRRRDLLYKWLVQVTVCLHWFNPLVHLMGREITRACEFSCDEAVLVKAGCGSAQDYGQTLLAAMAAVGRYRENPGAVNLSENKQLLKERLVAIMNFRKKTVAARLLTGLLTLCVTFGAAFIGVYPAAAAAAPAAGKPQAAVSKHPAQAGTVTGGGEDASQAERYYRAGSLPLFQIAFSRLDGEARDRWLGRIYADGQMMFWGAAVGVLDEDCALIRHYAEKTYEDGNLAYFSALISQMSDGALEVWLDQALEDGRWNFQSALFSALDRDDEFDEPEKKHEEEWEAAMAAEYRAAGVTVDGKSYRYRGQLVNVFLDIRPNESFYTLDLNPAGTVNIKILRSADNRITGVAYLTDAEVAELFGDGDDPEDEADLRIIPVDLKAVPAGSIIDLGKYTLSAGDQIRYDVYAETGGGMQVFFARDGRLNPACWSVHNLRQRGEPLQCTADFTVAPPAVSGTYQLFIRATDGALGGVTGSISIAPAGAA